MDRGIFVGQTPGVAPPRKALTAAQRRAVDRATKKLQEAEGELEEARQEWASVVSGLPQSDVARHLGMTRQAVAHRVKAARKR
jgi:hypothetical protein